MKLSLKLFLGIFIFAIFIKAEEGTKYGKNIELKEITKISQILANPAEFLGKKVLVEGTVVDVCEKRGCWIGLSSDKEFETIRVKVNDGEIVFPMEAKGKTAMVEGEVYSFDMEVEESCSQSETKTCGTDEHKKQTKTIYQIKGLGAVIK